MDENAMSLKCLVAPNPGAMTGAGTNTWILGTRQIIVIDPGPASEAHHSAICHAIRAAQDVTIAVTHGHLDHVGGARALQQTLGAPIACLAPNAFAPIAPRVAGLPNRDSFQPVSSDIALRDSDSLIWDGGELIAYHMPGHSCDHLCFSWDGHLFCGDLVLPKSSSAVLPPEGSILQILDSLERIKQGRWTTGLPGHGPVIENLPNRASELLQHRKQRLLAVFHALNADWQTAEQISAKVYTMVDTKFGSIIAQAVMAQLLALEELGAATLKGQGTNISAKKLNDTVISALDTPHPNC